MIRKLFRRGLRLGAIAGAILFLIQVFLRNPAPKHSGSSSTTTDRPRPGPGPVPAPPAPAARPAPASTSSGGNGTGTGTTVKDDGAPARSAKKAPATKASAAGEADAPAWVDPVDGECPPTHPVKVKLASGIYHVPGGLAYDRTTPDRCYRDAAAAETDGFRPSKR